MKLDFTRAALPPSGEVDLDVRAICGDVEIIVPDGAEVEMEATPVVGSVERRLRSKGAGERLRAAVTRGREAAHEDPAFFRIVGTAIFGSIRVQGR